MCCALPYSLVIWDHQHQIKTSQTGFDPVQPPQMNESYETSETGQLRTQVIRCTLRNS